MLPSLQDAAKRLEASYLTQMLSAAGYDRILTGDAAQFSHFLLEAQAEAMVARGGIGLSEQIFTLLSERSTA